MLGVGTKSDLVEPAVVDRRVEKLCRVFGVDFIATSAITGFGIDRLKETMDKKLVESAVAGGRGGIENDTKSWVGLTSRHRQSVTEAMESLGQAIDALKEAGGEVAAMLLRAAYQSISDIERQDIDERILENIFSRFCVGK
ncbi:tRNA modification GTPase MnmE [subsurface metagenome]